MPCSACGKLVSRRAAHGMHKKCWANRQAELRPQPVAQPAQATGGLAEDRSPEPGLATMLPDLMDIAVAPISTPEYLDARTLAVAEREYKRCLANVVLFNRQDAWDVQAGDDDAKRRARVAWTELYMFSKTCLPTLPGGKAKQKRNTAARLTRLD